MNIHFFWGAVFLVLANSVNAFDFTPSEAEFLSWDERCKKVFSSTSVARKTGFYNHLSQQQLAEASRFGEDAGGAWHYCAGVILLQRAGATTGREREGNLKRAVAEMAFTARKIRPEHQWYPEIHIDYARAHYISGNKAEAFTILQQLTNSHPAHSLPYTALAYYLKKENQLEQAIMALQQAPELLLNESAELNYFLGWYLMEANRNEAAVVHAKRAYELDYPVPTLRQRLAARGLSW